MDRRFLLAILLMTAVLIVPSILFRPPAVPISPDSLTPAPRERAVAAPVAPAAEAVPNAVPAAEQLPMDTVRVSTDRYTYGIQTRGGALVEATLHGYPDMAPGAARRAAQILAGGSRLAGLGVVVGRDTVSFADWDFVPRARGIAPDGGSTLTLTGQRGPQTVTLTYTFRPDDYRIAVQATLEGFGPNGGVLLVDLGPGLRNTEADSAEHLRNLGLVTKQAGTELLRFSSLKLGVPREVSGPFEWAAVKSKYFVAAVFGFDESPGAGATGPGRIGGVRIVATDPNHRQSGTADITATLPLPVDGVARFDLYVGPMVYSRLTAMGHDFDDVNPYGWPGFRTVIRPVAVGARWLLVWMHENLALSYGVVLILFGVIIRVLLWPLNQKAMRSSMKMQAAQPYFKEAQEKFKGDPARLQQEMLRLYKEHEVNPVGGCLPMLLPMPVLFALFFVLQNTIELRGASFLWLGDLSRPDPVYVIPILLGASMFALSMIGQIGIPPNPQTKMMVYVMPAVMTFLFMNFASGLNLYYMVQNVASLPQQWLLSQERMRRMPPPPPPPPASKRRS